METNQKEYQNLTLIWMGFLEVRFEVGLGVKFTTPLCLKLVNIMLET